MSSALAKHIAIMCLSRSLCSFARLAGLGSLRYVLISFAMWCSNKKMVDIKRDTVRASRLEKKRVAVTRNQSCAMAIKRALSFALNFNTAAAKTAT